MHYLWIWQNHKKFIDDHAEIPGFFMILKAVVVHLCRIPYHDIISLGLLNDIYLSAT